MPKSSHSKNCSDLKDQNQRKLKVLTLYDDIHAGKKAQATYSRLLKYMTEKTLNHQIWSFNVLSIPEIKKCVAQDAATADVIIVAANQEKCFEPDLRRWFSESLCAKPVDQNCALIALLGSHQQSPHPERNFLQRVAERAEFQFIHQNI